MMMGYSQATGGGPMDTGPKIVYEPARLVLNRYMGSTARFDLVGEEGQHAHEKIFSFKTIVQGQEFVGQGRSKKLAQLEACEKALLTVFNTKCINMAGNGQQPQSSLGKHKASGDANGQQVGVKTSLMRLNELRKGLEWSCSEMGNTKNKIYTYTVLVDGQAYQGEASNKQAAKQNAAFAAMKVVEPNFVEGQPLIKKSKGVQNNMQQIGGGITVTGDHPRMVLNQQVGKPVDIVVIDSNGQSLDTKITVKIVVQEQEFFGTASNKKGAAQQACENALWALYGIQYNAALAKSQPGPTGKPAPLFHQGGHLHME